MDDLQHRLNLEAVLAEQAEYSRIYLSAMEIERRRRLDVEKMLEQERDKNLALTLQVADLTAARRTQAGDEVHEHTQAAARCGRDSDAESDDTASVGTVAAEMPNRFGVTASSGAPLGFLPRSPLTIQLFSVCFSKHGHVFQRSPR